MEPRLGADFSAVRIHEAPQETGAIRAQAFTHGQDIYFNAGKYSPGSSSGKELLAHELTHVVQQSGGQVQAKYAARRAEEPAVDDPVSTSDLASAPPEIQQKCSECEQEEKLQARLEPTADIASDLSAPAASPVSATLGTSGSAVPSSPLAAIGLHEFAVDASDSPAEQQADAVAKDAIAIAHQTTTPAPPSTAPNAAGTLQQQGLHAELAAPLSQATGQDVDLSGVTFHTDSRAADMAQQIGANAFTHGQDIYFGAGQTPGVNPLTLHEAAHAVLHDDQLR